jgi:1-acyl-sn-glycerol-3-phosphate acyltransferase
MGVAWRWVSVLAHLLHGWLIVVFVFPRLDDAARRERICVWSNGLLKRLRVQLQVNGAFPAGACMIAANHISWLDIFVVFAIKPASFVSKAEAGTWPMIGRLLAAARTTLIDRGRRKAVHEALQEMRHKLRDGWPVAFFPEGTTSDGTGLLPFHANLFEAAMPSKTDAAGHYAPPVVPVAIRYEVANRICLDAAYIGDMSLLQSLHLLIKSPPKVARMRMLDALAPSTFETRHALSNAVQHSISEALRSYS